MHKSEKVLGSEKGSPQVSRNGAGAWMLMVHGYF